MSVGDKTDRQLDALCAYSGKSKTAVMESLLAYEHGRLVMEGKIKLSATTVLQRKITGNKKAPRFLVSA